MSQPVVIGAVSRVADRDGTHEPDEIVDFPSPALVELATSGVLDPETGEPYCTLVGSAPPPSSKKAAPDEPAPENT